MIHVFRATYAASSYVFTLARPELFQTSFKKKKHPNHVKNQHLFEPSKRLPQKNTLGWWVASRGLPVYVICYVNKNIPKKGLRKQISQGRVPKGFTWQVFKQSLTSRAQTTERFVRAKRSLVASINKKIERENNGLDQINGQKRSKSRVKYTEIQTHTITTYLGRS